MDVSSHLESVNEEFSTTIENNEGLHNTDTKDNNNYYKNNDELEENSDTYENRNVNKIKTEESDTENGGHDLDSNIEGESEETNEHGNFKNGNHSIDEIKDNGDAESDGNDDGKNELNNVSQKKTVATIVLDSDDDCDNDKNINENNLQITKTKNKVSINDISKRLGNNVRFAESTNSFKSSSISENADSSQILSNRVSILGSNIRKSSRNRSKEMANYFKKLPPDVEAMVNNVELQSMLLANNMKNGLYSVPNTQVKNISGKIDKHAGKTNIEKDIIQNLAACGTQISFGNVKSTENPSTAHNSSSYKPNVSIFLAEGDEAPQDLTISKKKKSSEINLKINDSISIEKPKIQLPVPSKKPEVGRSQKATPTESNKMSPCLDAQLVEKNTVLEVASIFSPFVIESPSIHSLSETIKQLKKTIEENPDDPPYQEDEEEVATRNIVEEMTKEKASEEHKQFFTSSLGKFFIEVGFNLVQEYVQKDLIDSHKSQSKYKRQKLLESDVEALEKSYESTKKRTESFKCELKKCDYCNYVSESQLSILNHLESPHLIKQMYCCNFCSYQAQVRNLTDFHQHMIVEHGITPKYEKQTTVDCPNCEFSCKNRKALEKHSVYCATQFKEETNLVPDVLWEPPVKLLKINSQPSLLTINSFENNNTYSNNNNYLSTTNINNNLASMGTLRIVKRLDNSVPFDAKSAMAAKTVANAATPKPPSKKSRQKYDVLLKAQMTELMYSLYHETNPIKIRETMQRIQILESLIKTPELKKGIPDIVMCEICDGYLNGKAEFRLHLMNLHNIKIHPRLLNQNPNLNCEKCEQKFYTDQGLERHLLGRHGLVSKMLQNAATLGQDVGMCPLCGKYIPGGLLAHVADTHHVVLRPAFLSYKCTVCSATFPAYSLFETHVYTEHKTVLPVQM